MVAALGEEDADVVCRWYDVTDPGNFEHANVLHRTVDLEQMSRLCHRPAEEIATILADARRRLCEVRSRRVRPGRDDKVLTSWSALMIGAFAEAYKVLGDVAYRTAAERGVAFVYAHLHRDGRLLRTFKDGVAKLDAYLDDYAFLLNALLDLYEGTFDLALIARARELGDALLARFEDRERGGFFLTSADHEILVQRPKPSFDGSIPSGNSAAANGLLRLYYYVGDARYLASAERTLQVFARAMAAQPFGFGEMLAVADLYLRKPREIVVVGAAADAATGDLLARIHRRYLPNKTVTLADPSAGAVLPLAREKPQVDGHVTAYVCHDYTCSPPVTTWDALGPLLAAGAA